MKIPMWLVQLQNGNGNPGEGTGEVDWDPYFEAIRTEPIYEVNWIEVAHIGLVFIFVAAGFLSLVFMIWGGIQFIVSGGKEEKTGKAVQTIRNAFIGLIITILSFTVVSIVGRLFGLELLNYLNFHEIMYDVNNFFRR